MKNLILRQGDFVKYINPDQGLDHMGFKLGQTYMVTKVLLSVLAVASETSRVTSLVVDGELTDSADNFAIVKDQLPRGLN